MTTKLRDYTKIEEKNCQLVTHYGGKEFSGPHVTNGTSDEVVIADYGNKEVIIFDKDLKLIRTFGQGSGDSKLSNPIGVAVGPVADLRGAREARRAIAPPSLLATLRNTKNSMY